MFPCFPNYYNIIISLQVYILYVFLARFLPTGLFDFSVIGEQGILCSLTLVRVETVFDQKVRLEFKHDCIRKKLYHLMAAAMGGADPFRPIF
ncbi:hypothetical protein HanRHA438_Chr06g0260341 [Helianthus annuus]|nr:hypothetical protein HanRHA438_Chr06g0260341 [Helianthus annuus]